MPVKLAKVCAGTLVKYVLRSGGVYVNTPALSYVNPAVPTLATVTLKSVAANPDASPAAQLSAPDPSVIRYCPGVPSVFGSVQTTLAPTVTGAVNPT